MTPHIDYYLILYLLDNIAKEVSSKLGLPRQVILNVYKSFWEFIKDTAEELPLKEDLTEEDFNDLKLNFNLPYIGKLYCNYDTYVKTKKIHYKSNVGHKHKENKANV